VLQRDVELAQGFAARWHAVKRALRRAPAVDYMLLGGEHYGPLLQLGAGAARTPAAPAAPGIARCSWSTGGYAFVARYGRLRRLAGGESVDWLLPCAAVVPSMAYRRKPAAAPLALLAGLASGGAGRGGSPRGAQRWIETHWQRLLQGLLAYAVFTQLAELAKRRLHAVAT